MNESSFIIVSDVQRRRLGGSGLPSASPAHRPSSIGSHHASSGGGSSNAAAASGIDAAAFNQAVQKLNEALNHLPTVAVVKF